MLQYVHVECSLDTPKVRDCADIGCLGARRTQTYKHDTGQNADNCNHNKKLNKRKTSIFYVGQSTHLSFEYTRCVLGQTAYPQGLHGRGF
jgi:hypothetical protein